MLGNFDKCLTEILIHEGGFVNHSKDPGGMTNLGVTKQTYEEWIGHKVSERVMRSLTPQLVSSLYKKRYWSALRCDDLPPGLDLCIFDFGVNAGPARSGRYLQRMVGAKEDGQIGPGTLQLVKEYVERNGLGAAIRSFQERRRSYYGQLPTFSTFGRGWLRRVDEVEGVALKMSKEK